MRTVLTVRAMARAANFVDGLAQHSLVFGAVRIVTAKTGDTALIHEALHEIIALHAVFVGSAIGEMSERLLTELILFELPKILEIHPDVEADRPVVVFSADRTLQWLPLRVALNAYIRRLSCRAAPG